MIGGYNRRIGIYRPEVTTDEFGGSETRWLFWSASWAKITPMKPRETSSEGRGAIIISYKVTIRFRDQFPERARILWNGKILRTITASDPDGRRERLHLICEEEQQ